MRVSTTGAHDILIRPVRHIVTGTLDLPARRRASWLNKGNFLSSNGFANQALLT